MEPIPVFIDTDIGDDIDDAIALAYALLNSAFSVKGVSTVGHWGENRARIIQSLVGLTGNESPISIGRETASTGHGPPVKSGQLDWASRHLPEVRRADHDAPRLMYETASQHPHELYLVTFGPLTNVAEAFYRYPDLPDLLAGVCSMGGELTIFRREHNIAGDYMAADAVLRKARKIFLATWSVGQQLQWSPSDLDALSTFASPVADLLAELHEAWRGGRQPVLYDIIPLLYLEDQNVVDTQRRLLRVETTGLYTRGVVVDMSRSNGLDLSLCSVPYLDVDEGANCDVTTGIDVEYARKMISRVFGIPVEQGAS